MVFHIAVSGDWARKTWEKLLMPLDSGWRRGYL
jgi:hypothetical protein